MIQKMVPEGFASCIIVKCRWYLQAYKYVWGGVSQAQPRSCPSGEKYFHLWRHPGFQDLSIGSRSLVNRSSLTGEAIQDEQVPSSNAVPGSCCSRLLPMQVRCVPFQGQVTLITGFSSFHFLRCYTEGRLVFPWLAGSTVPNSLVSFVKNIWYTKNNLKHIYMYFDW